MKHLPLIIVCIVLFILAILDRGKAQSAGHTCGAFSCDVPAIEETTAYDTGGVENCRSASKDSACKEFPKAIVDPKCAVITCDKIMGKQTRITCADKSRILETAEDGKHWCHAPMVNE